MWEVKVGIKLSNWAHIAAVKAGIMNEDEMMSVYQDMIVDTWAVEVCLPEEIIEKLWLIKLDEKYVTFADWRQDLRWIYWPLWVEFQWRRAMTDCISLPWWTTALLWQIPLESMDLVVDCRNRKLIPNPESHSPYVPVLKCY